MTETGSPGAGATPVHALPPRPRATPSSTVIRTFHETEAEAVATLWRESAVEWPGGGPFGGRHASAEGVRHEQRARHPLATFIAWRRDPDTGAEVAVGYCSLLLQPEDATATYVGLLTAHPAWHGQGVGRDLLIAAIARTIEVGRDRVDLHTWSGNLKAVPLYKKVGFFWVPDTSVRMANFLPMLMRVGPVRDFFAATGADWYADAVRRLDLVADRDRCGAMEVYRHAWERDGARLEAMIDRHANALVSLATPDLEVGIALDDPRVPTGTRRNATFHLAVPAGRPAVAATFVASGSGAIRTSRQAHHAVAPGERTDVAWPVEGTLAGAPAHVRPGMASPDIVSVLAVVNDVPLTLTAAARVVPPVTITIDDPAPLFPTQERLAWATVENETDDHLVATVRATATGPFTVNVAALPRTGNDARGIGEGAPVSLAPRARAALPLRVRASGQGSGRLHVAAAHGGGPPTTVEVPLHAGHAGCTFVDHSDAHVRVTTDDLVVTAPLANSGWQPTFTVADRHGGHALLRHACGLGPPFSPSPISACAWTPSISHEPGAVTVVLRAAPADLPGTTFERHLRITASGLVDVCYRLVNGSDSPLTFDVGTGTSAELDGARHTRITCVVDGEVVDDESDAFPDWEEPSGGATRLSEGWIAEHGDGMVVGAIWTDATDVHGDGRLAELVLPLGTAEPGTAATTGTIRLYAGPGDWRAVRARWRAFVGDSPGAPPAREARPRTRGVDVARIANPFAIDDAHATEIALDRANDTPRDGTLAIVTGAGLSRQVLRPPASVHTPPPLRDGRPDTGRGNRDGATSPPVPVSGVRAHASARVPVTIPVPSRPGAVEAVARLATDEVTHDLAVPLVRVGRRHAPVATTVDESGVRPVVTLDTGAMRVRVMPTQRARLVAIETRDRDGAWVNHLLASEPEPRPWTWFNPWYGGISAHLRESGWHTGHSPLDQASWTWRPATVSRAGIEWHGVVAAATLTAPDGAIDGPDAVERARLAGTSIEVACLVAGGGTAIALEATVRNASAARLRGTLSMPTYWQPGGRVEGTTIHYERRGARSRRRVPGAHWSMTEGWVAIADATGTAVPVVVAADTGAALMGGDMGLHGVHPFASTAIDLAPGEERALRLWVAIAADLDEARAWRHLVGTPLLPS